MKYLIEMTHTTPQKAFDHSSSAKRIFNYAMETLCLGGNAKIKRPQVIETKRHTKYR